MRDVHMTFELCASLSEMIKIIMHKRCREFYVYLFQTYFKFEKKSKFNGKNSKTNFDDISKFMCALQYQIRFQKPAREYCNFVST